MLKSYKWYKHFNVCLPLKIFRFKIEQNMSVVEYDYLHVLIKAKPPNLVKFLSLWPEFICVLGKWSFIHVESESQIHEVGQHYFPCSHMLRNTGGLGELAENSKPDKPKYHTYHCFFHPELELLNFVHFRFVSWWMWFNGSHTEIQRHFLTNAFCYLRTSKSARIIAVCKRTLIRKT